VLVTGANSGIGLATALHLAGRGWTVLGTARTRAKATHLREQAHQRGVAQHIRPIVLDVSDHEAVIARWPRLPDFYAVVNNAGASLTGAVEEVSPTQAKDLLDVNLVAPAVVAACALPRMRRRGSGRIVMVSSLAGRVALLPLHGWYHASKFGLEALSDVLRREVAPFGVRVSLVEPGFIRTAILDKADAALRDHGDAGPYGSAYERVESITSMLASVAPPPDAVARAITSAIESRRPRHRYQVGVESVPLRGFGLMPDAITDRVVSLVSDLRARDDRAPGPR
jgi:NAD(P)-dependent dehydrogenase (short-subunit alcohol dehydrogenase family)